VFYIYVLQSLKDNNFYVGFTENLKKRYFEHQDGKVFSTKSRTPFRLIYYETYILKEDALCREKYLKTSMGKRVLKKQLSHFIKTIKSGKIALDSEVIPTE